MIDQALDQKMTGSRMNSVDASAVFPQQASMLAASCVHKDKFRLALSMILKPGVEFCNNDGELLDKVDAVSKDWIRFFTPGKGTSVCYMGSTCTMVWAKDRDFHIERINEDDNSKLYALVRIKSKETR